LQRLERKARELMEILLFLIMAWIAIEMLFPS
jgi:hypothetical protein